MSAYQSDRLQIQRKPDGSFVTNIDLEAERLLREAIAAEFATDGILGEEEPERVGESGWRWVLDPIDGTESFLRGIPHFCTLIGIELQGAATVGVATFPALGEMLSARLGAGAIWRTASGIERPATVSGVTEMSDAVLEIGAWRAFERRGLKAQRQSLVSSCRRARGWSDGYAYALVATGRVDAAIQVGLKRWDVSAFVPIIQEAGGRVTDWTGAGLPYDSRCMACAPDLLEPLAACLTE